MERARNEEKQTKSVCVCWRREWDEWTKCNNSSGNIPKHQNERFEKLCCWMNVHGVIYDGANSSEVL